MGFSINNNNNNNSPSIKIKIGKNESTFQIQQEKLQGTRVDKHSTLINFLENTQGIQIDKNNNGIIEDEETSIFYKALSTLAGDNGIIEQQDFKVDKELDKDSRKYLSHLSNSLAEDTTQSKVVNGENGDYKRYNSVNTLMSGRENGVSFKQEPNKKVYDDGREITYNSDGKESSGKTADGKTFTTSYNGYTKVRNFNHDGLKIFYDNNGKELYRKDFYGESYTYQQNEDGSYSKSYIDSNETKFFNKDNEYIGGIDNEKIIL